MLYTSTRGLKGLVPSAGAIKQGLAGDGGLYVPVNFPRIGLNDIERMCSMDYSGRANKVMAGFLTDFSDGELQGAIGSAYSHEKFGEDMAPVHMINNKLGILELWHGPTCAFKDVALQLLPRLLTLSAAKTGEQKEILILVATSGDTGKAALEGFKDVPGTKIMVFYPSEGISAIQKLQMITTEGSNVKVVGLQGNFDDCQRGVKEIFNDAEFNRLLDEQGVVLSSANSINWGRLVPQIVYYFSAYCDLVNHEAIKLGDKINFVVPTGNFGDILAGYYALRMGLPVHKLICASNSNNVLAEFLHSGIYDRKREFYKTMSPSMDILVSSNLERLLYYLTNGNQKKVSEYMSALNTNGRYQLGSTELKHLNEIFYGSWADEERTSEQIQLMYMVNNYVIDPHTAVAMAVLSDYRQENPRDNAFNVVLSTASPFKFGADVLRSLSKKADVSDPVGTMENLGAKANIQVPEQLRRVTEKPVLHPDVTDYAGMRSAVKQFLGL